jgi:hypothetical protein
MHQERPAELELKDLLLDEKAIDAMLADSTRWLLIGDPRKFAAPSAMHYTQKAQRENSAQWRVRW